MKNITDSINEYLNESSSIIDDLAKHIYKEVTGTDKWDSEITKLRRPAISSGRDHISITSSSIRKVNLTKFKQEITDSVDAFNKKYKTKFKFDGEDIRESLDVVNEAKVTAEDFEEPAIKEFLSNFKEPRKVELPVPNHFGKTILRYKPKNLEGVTFWFKPMPFSDFSILLDGGAVFEWHNAKGALFALKNIESIMKELKKNNQVFVGKEEDDDAHERFAQKFKVDGY